MEYVSCFISYCFSWPNPTPPPQKMSQVFIGYRQTVNSTESADCFRKKNIFFQSCHYILVKCPFFLNKASGLKVSEAQVVLVENII